MGSGLLLVIVLGLWAIVLYPTFAKNREQSNETKSIARFNNAMKSISELIPDRKSDKGSVSLTAAKRRRNVTYFLFLVNIGIIISSYFNYVPQTFSFVPLGILLLWLTTAFIAAQRLSDESKPIVTNVIRKNYVIHKKPVETKTFIKTDPERDLIMDERPFEKVEEKVEQEVTEGAKFFEALKKAKGA
ncbi:MAG: hypothetical protein ACKOQL_04460 [Actinomycetes bacterium]